MRILLALLLSFLLLHTEAYAISGGPNYGGGSTGGTVDLAGIYSGVLLPDELEEEIPLVPGAPDDGRPRLNGLGLFTLSIPSSTSAALGTGPFVMFDSGRVFRGTMEAVANPNTLVFRGVIEGSYNFSFSRFVPNGEGGVDTVTTQVTSSVIGTLEAILEAAPTQFGRLVLTGTADTETTYGYIRVSDLSPIIVNRVHYTVEGFKQSL
jgi:hypothetical protein